MAHKCKVPAQALGAPRVFKVIDTNSSHDEIVAIDIFDGAMFPRFAVVPNFIEKIDVQKKGFTSIEQLENLTL